MPHPFIFGSALPPRKDLGGCWHLMILFCEAALWNAAIKVMGEVYGYNHLLWGQTLRSEVSETFLC